MASAWDYTGTRKNGVAEVFRHRPGRGLEHGIPLDPRLDLVKHSPSGLEWGYVGSGPAQLALALLADALLSERDALEMYQRFKDEVVVYLPEEGWTLTEAQIMSALEDIRAERAPALQEE